MNEKPCTIFNGENILKFESPHFCLTFDISGELEALSLENKATKKRLSLGEGPELEADIDSAVQRIYITGWKVKDMKKTEKAEIDPNKEDGYVRGFFLLEYHDAEWKGTQSPWHGSHDRYKWARTHVFLPEKLKGLPFTLILGGWGLLDYRYIRAFINGQETGVRKTDQRWHEPGEFVINPRTPLYKSLHFGTDNVIALQLTGGMYRTQKLDEYDPYKGKDLAVIARTWPGQFEQYLVAGQPVETLRFSVSKVEKIMEGQQGEALVYLESAGLGISALIRYCWDAQLPYLHKFITIKNSSLKDQYLLNIRLGQYDMGIEVSEGEQGFPVYVCDEMFFALAHPSGWVTGWNGKVTMKQYPGKLLSPGESFACMEAVTGVAESGKARETFLSHIKSRMHRVKRGRDKVYAIYECFGSWSDKGMKPEWRETEEILLDSIAKINEGQRDSGCNFDYYSVEFWVDFYGDIARANPKSFPEGMGKVRDELQKLGIKMGLWIDSSLIGEGWGIGGNPVVAPCRTYDYAAYITKTQSTGEDALCRASDPFKSIFNNGLLHHINENNVRLLKFDNAMAICHNTNHEHLPGIYSTEAIHNAFIETLQRLDAECHEVFLMLYWGHRSPWWLLYSDTLFESGLLMEASTPASFPTLYGRDGVILGLDQAQWWCGEYIPPLGKDSLGVWLSEWAWNSSVGKERWQEGIVMDMCRGNLLMQPWGDEKWLSPDEREELALFNTLLKNSSSCFANPRFIIGNPWNNEPYGYSCTDGERVFLTINNCSWKDITLKLELNEKWGIPSHTEWEMVQWYPVRKKLLSESGYIADQDKICSRPFTTTLFELYPKGKESCVAICMEESKTDKTFDEPSCDLSLNHEVIEPSFASPVPLDEIETENKEEHTQARQAFRVNGMLPASNEGGTMALNAKMFKNGLLFKLQHTGRYFSAHIEIDGEEIPAQPIIGLKTYPVPWQGWRIKASPCSRVRSFEAIISVAVDSDVKLRFEGHFIPC